MFFGRFDFKLDQDIFRFRWPYSKPISLMASWIFELEGLIKSSEKTTRTREHEHEGTSYVLLKWGEVRKLAAEWFAEDVFCKTVFDPRIFIFFLVGLFEWDERQNIKRSVVTNNTTEHAYAPQWRRGTCLSWTDKPTFFLQESSWAVRIACQYELDFEH